MVNKNNLQMTVDRQREMLSALVFDSMSELATACMDTVRPRSHYPRLLSLISTGIAQQIRYSPDNLEAVLILKKVSTALRSASPV